MNTADRRSLVLEPRPSDVLDGRVVLVGRDWMLAWMRDGRTAEAFGPAFDSVSDAAAAAKYVRSAHGLV